MRDKDGKRERKKAREQRRAEGKKKKLSGEAESRREKILPEHVSRQMHDEDEDEEDPFSGWQEWSNRDHSETDEGIWFRKRTKQGVALQEADVLSGRISEGKYKCTHAHMRGGRYGKRRGRQRAATNATGQLVEKLGDEESQLISTRRD